MAVAGVTTPSMAGGHQRQLEAEGVDLPGDVDVLGVAGAPAGDDGDVVEPVGPPTGLADADLDLGHSGLLQRETSSLSPDARPLPPPAPGLTGAPELS